jgi:hypothetical protein
MKCGMYLGAALIVMLSSPLSARAQSIPDGFTHGAYVGNNVAGPVGAVVGGAVGGVVGGFEGALDVGPLFAAYPVEAAPPVPYHAHRARHSYRHVHPHYGRAMAPPMT